MIVISITMMLVFLLGMLVFSCSKFLCILGILISLIVILLKMNLIPLKNISQKNINRIATLSLAIVFILGGFTSITSVDGGIIAYENQLEEAMKLLEKDKIDEARQLIESIKENYGASDNTILLETLGFLAEEDYDNAKRAIYSYSSKISYDYYTLLEMLYIAEGPEENNSQLRSLYLEAALVYPYWTYVQKMAGIALINDLDFASAEYHLLRAYEQEPSDYKTAYYLGVASYEQKHMEEAMIFFQEAIDRQADEETMGYIAWYTQEIGK